MENLSRSSVMKKILCRTLLMRLMVRMRPRPLKIISDRKCDIPDGTRANRLNSNRDRIQKVAKNVPSLVMSLIWIFRNKSIYSLLHAVCTIRCQYLYSKGYFQNTVHPPICGSLICGKKLLYEIKKTRTKIWTYTMKPI